MYSRSNSVTLTVQQESFGFSRMATRSTQPEVFTFERIPAQATAVRSYVPIRPKKRCTRVMYPAKVRMHLPPPEKSQAKRWLVILCMVVLWQIYTEEPCADTPLSSAESPIGDYQGFAFQSAEEQARQLTQLSASSELLSAAASSCEDNGSSTDPNTTCPTPSQESDSSRSFEQSTAGNGYMVALLVYHRLGSDN
ncbi:radiation-inducible immediate-early gene IEX-1 [Seriola aureovittata]|uniref:radiation-inducible immediate-early gene IEX-1 n=1 Tax=Seriola aureovittata TaxID=2871759 RepID=UPI0024BD9724|nr:radiation-inducible immediate-early gene IEX-1 [Seriola aureovittata]